MLALREGAIVNTWMFIGHFSVLRGKSSFWGGVHLCCRAVLHISYSFIGQFLEQQGDEGRASCLFRASKPKFARVAARSVYPSCLNCESSTASKTTAHPIIWIGSRFCPKRIKAKIAAKTDSRLNINPAEVDAV